VLPNDANFGIWTVRMLRIEAFSLISQETLERELKIRPSQPGRIVSPLPNLPAWFDTNQAVDGE